MAAKNNPTHWGMGATLLIAIAVAILTLAPVGDLVGGSDKLYHMLAFAALAFPLPAARPRLWPWMLVLAVLYGGTIELIQPSFGRTADLIDFAADALGAAAGGFAGALTGRLYRRWSGRRMSRVIVADGVMKD